MTFLPVVCFYCQLLMLLVSCVLFPSHTVRYTDSEQCIIYASAACFTYGVPVRKALHV